MKKQQSQKVLKWEQNDYVKNLLVYAINAIVFMGLFVGASIVSGRTLDDVFTKTADFFSFSVLIIMLFAVMVVYLGYENKNFLKIPKYLLLALNKLKNILICVLPKKKKLQQKN